MVRVDVRPGFQVIDGGGGDQVKWALLDSNQRPGDYESRALTTELRARRDWIIVNGAREAMRGMEERLS